MNYFDSIEIDHIVIHEGNNYIVSVEYFFATEGVFDDGDDECPPSDPEISWGLKMIRWMSLKSECVSIHENVNRVYKHIPEEEWNKDVVSLAMQIDYPDKEVLHDLYERRHEPNGDE